MDSNDDKKRMFYCGMHAIHMAYCVQTHKPEIGTIQPSNNPLDPTSYTFTTTHQRALLKQNPSSQKRKSSNNITDSRKSPKITEKLHNGGKLRHAIQKCSKKQKRHTHRKVDRKILKKRIRYHKTKKRKSKKILHAKGGEINYDDFQRHVEECIVFDDKTVDSNLNLKSLMPCRHHYIHFPKHIATNIFGCSATGILSDEDKKWYSDKYENDITKYTIFESFIYAIQKQNTSLNQINVISMFTNMNRNNYRLKSENFPENGGHIEKELWEKAAKKFSNLTINYRCWEINDGFYWKPNKVLQKMEDFRSSFQESPFYLPLTANLIHCCGGLGRTSWISLCLLCAFVESIYRPLYTIINKPILEQETGENHFSELLNFLNNALNRYVGTTELFDMTTHPKKSVCLLRMNTLICVIAIKHNIANPLFFNYKEFADTPQKANKDMVKGEVYENFYKEMGLTPAQCEILSGVSSSDATSSSVAASSSDATSSSAALSSSLLQGVDSGINVDSGILNDAVQSNFNVNWVSYASMGFLTDNDKKTLDQSGVTAKPCYLGIISKFENSCHSVLNK